MPYRRPQLGDIWHLADVSDTYGTELKGDRWGLVITEPIRLFQSETVFVALITKGGDAARKLGLAIPLQNMNLKTQGVVLCQHVRTLDLNKMPATYVETALIYLVDAVWDKIIINLKP